MTPLYAQLKHWPFPKGDEMLADFSFIVDIIKALHQYGVFYPVLIFLFIYFFRSPEKIEKWYSLFYRLFAWASEKSARKYISHNIQAEIRERSKKINSEVEGAMPYGLEIKWTNVEDVESEVREGKVIILMKDYHNQSVNLARAALVYTHEGLMPQVRPYVEKTLMKSIECITARKLVAGNTGGMRYLNEEIIEKEKKADQNLDLWMKKISEIDSQGLLTRIVFQDFQDYLGQLYPTDPTPAVLKASADYVDYIYNFITRTHEEKVPPLSSDVFPTQIVPIAIREKVETLGFVPHLQFVEALLQRGRKRFHIIAAGKANVELAKVCAEEMSRKLSLVEKRKENYQGFYRGKRMNLLCVTLESP